MVDDNPTDDSDKTGAERRSDASPVHTPHLWVFDGDGIETWTHADTGLTITIRKQYGQSGRHDDYTWHGKIRGDDGAEPLTWGGSRDRDHIRAVAAKFMFADPDGTYDPDPDVGAWETDRPRWPDAFDHIEDESVERDEWLRD